MMNFFKISVHGTEFNPDDFLKQSSLKVDRIFRRGEPWVDEWNPPGFIDEPRNWSGVEIDLGDGKALSVREQDRIATRFLELHQDELARLARFAGVEYATLFLQCRTELEPSLRGFFLRFSPRLLHFALKTRVLPTFYVDLVVPDDEWTGCGES
jgi:hypothetical protein